MKLLKGIKEGQYRFRLFNPYASSKVKSEIDGASIKPGTWNIPEHEKIKIFLGKNNQLIN